MTNRFAVILGSHIERDPLALAKRLRRKARQPRRITCSKPLTVVSFPQYAVQFSELNASV